MAVIRQGIGDDIPALLRIWENAVRATHAFLDDAAIAGILPQVRRALGEAPFWTAEEDGAPVGFMIFANDMVEALFVDPMRARGGLGTAFIEYARALVSGRVLRVDVNEQNPGATAFYLAKGFRRVGRSDVDGQGRPYPLLHLELELNY